jgi:quercetin dioxygenase-like cupin family protein
LSVRSWTCRHRSAVVWACFPSFSGGPAAAQQELCAETEGEVFEFEAVLPSGLSGPPAHWHRVEQETFEVVEGRLRVRVGHAVRYLGPGESLVVAPGIVHAFSNPTDEQVRVITRETPADNSKDSCA